LGDGRALLLGEVNGFDIQLKGSGQTHFSRRGDGRSALGPVLREYIVSEAMHSLGVPTTRALCAVTTGEEVYRQDGAEPGGIFTRVSPSHIRVGTFQYFAFQSDIESQKLLVDYTLKRHYPKLLELPSYKEKALELLKKIIEGQPRLIGQWSALGFIHGVMNTDNFSLAAVTIDYGPCAFMDEFKFHKVFSSIDQRGRYSFFNQVPIAQWNILRLADCLLPFINEKQEQAVKEMEEYIVDLFPIFERERMTKLAEKLGIQDYQASDEKLVMSFLKYLEDEALDFTLAFRELPELFVGESQYLPQTQALQNFVAEWKSRVLRVDHLNQINPIYIPRNHQIQKAIEDAYQGNFSHFHTLLKVTNEPFVTRDEFEDFALAPKPEQRVCQTFCGT